MLHMSYYVTIFRLDINRKLFCVLQSIDLIPAQDIQKPKYTEKHK